MELESNLLLESGSNRAIFLTSMESVHTSQNGNLIDDVIRKNLRKGVSLDRVGKK